MLFERPRDTFATVILLRRLAERRQPAKGSHDERSSSLSSRDDGVYDERMGGLEEESAGRVHVGFLGVAMGDSSTPYSVRLIQFQCNLELDR
jgi:hypothetical protein